MAGFVYVLSNPSFTSVKIGKSDRDPSNRVAELSNSTGVPTPFNLEYYAFVTDHHDLERRCHVTLAAKRVVKNREFFNVTVVEAIECVKKVAGPDLKYEENKYAEWKEYEKEKTNTFLKALEARRAEAEKERERLRQEAEKKRSAQVVVSQKWQLLNQLLNEGIANSRERATSCISKISTRANNRGMTLWVNARVKTEKARLEVALRNEFTSRYFLSTARDCARASFSEAETDLIFAIEKFAFQTNHKSVDDLENVLRKVTLALKPIEGATPITGKSVYLSIQEAFKLIRMELKRSERNFPLRKEVYEDRYPLLKKDLFVLCQIYFTSDRPPPDSMRQSVRSTIYKRYRDASEMFSIFNPDEPDSIEPS